MKEKFNADFNKRLPKEKGEEILKSGKRIGEECHQKDCSWAGYEKDGKFYLSLNNDSEDFWEVSHEEVTDYCL